MAVSNNSAAIGIVGGAVEYRSISDSEVMYGAAAVCLCVDAGPPETIDDGVLDDYFGIPVSCVDAVHIVYD